MNLMYFKYFADPVEFPFFIYYALHDEDFDLHVHADFSELVVTLDGSATHCVGSEEYKVKRGDVFVVNGDTEHGFKDAESLRICNIMYRPEIINSPYLDIRKSAGFHALFVIEPHLAKSQKFKSRLFLGINDFKRVVALITDMVSENEAKNDGWQTACQSRFMQLITMLSRIYCLPASDINPNAINIAKTVSFIENNYKENISVSELAAMSNLSERHYLRIFKDTYKITPSGYILNLRFHYACRLLKSTSLKISDIALQSGFNDYNYFTRRFHEFFGITPSKYRVIDYL